MKKLKREHFCYGAVLSAIMEYNQDADFALLQRDNTSRKIYKIQTSTSKECVVFMKYAFEKEKDSHSWLYSFSENEKEYIQNCHENKIPIFIYLLCAVPTLRNSEIAVLRYDEFNEVKHKSNFTLSLRKNYSDFYLHRAKSPKYDLTIPRNRIEKPFDDLINDVINLSHGYYCPRCGTEIFANINLPE